MRVKIFLGNFFAAIPEHQMWAVVSRFGLIDVMSSPKEGEVYLGRLLRREQKLLTMVAHLQAQDDYLGAKALEADLFMGLRSRFYLADNCSLVIRKGFQLYSSAHSQQYPELDLCFSLAGLKEKYKAKQEWARSNAAQVDELVNDISPAFNPFGADLEIEGEGEDCNLSRAPWSDNVRNRFLYDMGM